MSDLLTDGAALGASNIEVSVTPVEVLADVVIWRSAGLPTNAHLPLLGSSWQLARPSPREAL